MKEMLVPIDQAGRVVLPKQMRDELAIKPGDLLNVSVEGGKVTLRPNGERAGFIRRGDALVFSTGEANLLDNEVVEHIRGSERGCLSMDVAKGLPHGKRK